MKKPQVLASIAAATLIAGSPAILAQDDEGGPDITPVEAWTCNYNDGMGADDLQKAIDGWNEWMDENDANHYFAATMTPHYYGPDSFDVAWIGASDSAEAMGAGDDAFRTDGQAQGAEFAKVLNCDSHSNFATITLKEAPERATPDSLVVSFSDCSAEEGKSMDDVFGAMGEWNAYQVERGYGNGAWAWFPVYGGGGEQEFDFKLVEAHDNHQALGADWDRMASGDYIKQGDLLGEVLDCDVARVYDTQIHRRPAAAE